MRNVSQPHFSRNKLRCGALSIESTVTNITLLLRANLLFLQKRGKIMKDIDFGTIRIRLADVMEDQQVSINKLAFRAEMQRTQLKAYKNNDVQRIDLSVLARLCYALDCDIKDLIEYLPPDKKNP